MTATIVGKHNLSASNNQLSADMYSKQQVCDPHLLICRVVCHKTCFPPSWLDNSVSVHVGPHSIVKRDIMPDSEHSRNQRLAFEFYLVATIWNSLPNDWKPTNAFATFKMKLKTMLA